MSTGAAWGRGWISIIEAEPMMAARLVLALALVNLAFLFAKLALNIIGVGLL